MAWRSSGYSNAELVNNSTETASSNTTTSPTPCATSTAPTTSSRAPATYRDSPQPIGHGATISAPHMHAHRLETPDPDSTRREGPRRRSGTGYLTALFAAFVGPTGVVIGIDHIPELVANSSEISARTAKPRSWTAAE